MYCTARSTAPRPPAVPRLARHPTEDLQRIRVGVFRRGSLCAPPPVARRALHSHLPALRRAPPPSDAPAPPPSDALRRPQMRSLPALSRAYPPSDALPRPQTRSLPRHQTRPPSDAPARPQTRPPALRRAHRPDGPTSSGRWTHCSSTGREYSDPLAQTSRGAACPTSAAGPAAAAPASW